MRLLSLGQYAQESVVSGKISQGHAKVLVGLDEKKQKVIVDSVAGQKLSVRETEHMVKNYKEKSTLSAKKPAEPALLEKYREALNDVLPFTYKQKAKSLEIYFENEKEIEAFIALLRPEKNQKPDTLLQRILK